jgi:N-acetylglucosamine kinase-like BadF-type ATPase
VTYYMAAEGGGTKLLTVLYDEQFRIIRMARTTGTNAVYRRQEDIEASMEKMTEELLDNSPEIQEIQRLDMSLVGSGALLVDVLNRHVAIRKFRQYGEGEVALAAAGITNGIVAQSGTGSDAFLIQPHVSERIGGWGPLLGDEGSGYDIGLMGLKAAIYAEEGRGPKTVLLPMVMEAFGLSQLWNLVRTVSDASDVRRTVGSAALLVAKAASLGDAVALDIYDRAAIAMSRQVLTALGRVQGVLQGPIVTSGGAWKGHRRMFDTFSATVRDAYPQVTVIFPDFEPVAGCIFLRLLDEGRTAEEAMAILRTYFPCLTTGGLPDSPG